MFVDYFSYQIRRKLFRLTNANKYRYYQLLRRSVSSHGYSLRPFDELKCIFVHLPKAAGISVSKTLFGNLGGGHFSTSTYQLIFSKAEFEQYYKFTFVRNPWDRLFSAYNFLKAGGINQADRDWAQRHLGEYNTFRQFVECGVPRATIRNHIHFVTQYSLLKDYASDHIPIDFIGHFESLCLDFQVVSSKLCGMNAKQLAHENRTVASAFLDYREHYSSSMKQVVEDFYSSDIQRFAYDFESTKHLNKQNSLLS